uniref:U2 small nuclear ribonucleoprotein A n=1 Tax=Rhizophora mucronata TaxID=61149 RepID=A0A2P2KW99_RHIMU
MDCKNCSVCTILFLTSSSIKDNTELGFNLVPSCNCLFLFCQIQQLL